MPVKLVLASIFFFICFSVPAQLYHYKTGKVVPQREPGFNSWKPGVFNQYPAEYGTLVVRENNHSVNSQLINLPVIRIKAIKDSTLTPIFILNGGPGESNLRSELIIDSLLLYHDIVLIGYRGVDSDRKLEGPYLRKALNDKNLSLENARTVFGEALDSCLIYWTQQKIDILGYSMNEVVNDIEITRKALNYSKISFLSFSYGTMLAQLYTQEYPSQVCKSVMIGARPVGDFLISGPLLNNQILTLFHYFSPDSLKDQAFNETLIINNVKQLFDSISKIENVNLERFLLFGFSQLYSKAGMENLINSAFRAMNGNTSDILSLYEKFYESYPGKIYLGDLICKKQGFVDANYSLDSLSEPGDMVANAVNNWYNQPISFCKTNSANLFTQKFDSIETLLICGEIDIASPPLLVKEKIKPQYPNSQLIIFPKSGHLDLFYDERKKMDQLLIDFYR